MPTLAPEWHRVNAIEGGRLVQCNERIGVVPVSTWLSVAIGDRDVCIRFRQQRIGKGEPHRTATDDKIVRANVRHRIEILELLRWDAGRVG